jgi:putative intracellular protease/amidase
VCLDLYEVAHAYYAFTKAGFTVHFVSPLGGQAPIDPQSLLDFKEETSCQEFLTDEDALEMIQKTKSPSSIDPSQYMMIFFIGGHGALFDLPGASELQKLAGAIYELGGIIGKHIDFLFCFSFFNISRRIVSWPCWTLERQVSKR